MDLDRINPNPHISTIKYQYELLLFTGDNDIQLVSPYTDTLLRGNTVVKLVIHSLTIAITSKVFKISKV